MELLLWAALASAGADELDAHQRRLLVFELGGYAGAAAVVAASGDEWARIVTNALCHMLDVPRG